MSHYFLRAVMAVAIPFMLTACVTPQARYVDLPNPSIVFADIDHTQYYYDFGSVKIDILPYNERELSEMQYVVNMRQSGDMILGLVPAITEVKPAVIPQADAYFRLNITNQMDRVLRVADAIVQVRVNNQRSQTITPAFAEAAFNSYTILPGQSETLFIGVPEIKKFGGSGQIEIAIYDIPVAIDESGRITKRDNLDAVFIYSINEGVISVISETAEQFVTPSAFRKYQTEGTFTEEEILREIYGITSAGGNTMVQ